MLKTKKGFSVALLMIMAVFFLLAGCNTQSASTQNANTNEFKGKSPKYVFLFIGDGTGMPQISATEMYLGNKKDPKKPGIEKLDFTQFPAQGMNTTFAADTFITDSASAGTAFATGNKTNDGVINMDPEKKVKFKSIAEYAKEKGLKVGVVSSVSIDHATPAVMYAHQPSRNNYYDIEIELGKSNFDYFGGGGFLQPTGPNKDKPDAYEEAKKNGYKVVKTKEEFEKLSSKDSKVIAESPKLDASKALPFAINNDKNAIPLADFTKKGIELLDNPKGFFMMVEGGKVDWAGHANDAAASIFDVIAFNDAIKQALEFYEKHKDETLIIVTGDHETGGMTLGFAGTKYFEYLNKLSNQKISYDEFGLLMEDYKKTHTGDNAKIEDVLPLIKEKYGLFAMDANEYNALSKKAADPKDPGAKEAADKIAMALSPKDVDDLKVALKQDPKAKDDQSYLLYGGYEPVTMAVTHILNQKAGIGFTTYSHTGVPIPVYAKGNGQNLFAGYFDNTDIFKKLTSILGIAVK